MVYLIWYDYVYFIRSSNQQEQTLWWFGHVMRREKESNLRVVMKLNEWKETMRKTKTDVSGVSGSWGPQFCGALCKGVTPRWGSGWGCCRPPSGVPEANILKIGWKSGILVAAYTHNLDPISDVVAYEKSRYPSRL